MMSFEPKNSATATDDESRIRFANQYKMSAEAVEKVFEVMERTGMSFADTAVHLGFIREQDRLGEERDGEQAQAGLIETMIARQRLSARRDIVVHEGQEVTPGPQLQVAFEAANPRSEKMRALRTELLLLNETAHSTNVVVIMSPSSGEGRSQLCAELALSFAQLGRRTLLLDADMRSPHQHVLFRAPNQFGLSQAISQNAKPFLHPVKGVARMYLLTAGLVPSNPLELLSDGRFQKLLNDWRSNYEFVIIDTPPVCRFADALAVATIAGRVIILSRAKLTSYKSTREMLRRLETTRAQILGGVISHF
ncbi:MAG TPA: CpsD/CapB family tyrosine-protein kinase [Steroidobacteraceae bacterium]|jgi:capsular exopolysaccharide synthesis family protein|nr:CpsD/CapB family tyrosine-protein kinase [Steroidobacteraceae bacterium]